MLSLEKALFIQMQILTEINMKKCQPKKQWMRVPIYTKKEMLTMVD